MLTALGKENSKEEGDMPARENRNQLRWVNCVPIEVG